MALYKIPQVSWSCDFVVNQFPHEFEAYYPAAQNSQQWVSNSSPADHVFAEDQSSAIVTETMPSGPRRQHRRTNKNLVQIQNLHSLLPESYIQKGDEASILGGAIEYVKELEQELQFLCVKDMNNSTANLQVVNAAAASDGCRGYQLSTACGDHLEVTMAGENHVDLKLHSKWRPKLLPRLISRIESLSLTVLHFNLSRADEFVLCSLSLKVEDGSKFTSVKRIATVVNRILARIQEEDERV